MAVLENSKYSPDRSTEAVLFINIFTRLQAEKSEWIAGVPGGTSSFDIMGHKKKIF